MDGIALQLDEVPARYHAAGQRLVYVREGAKEMRFSFFERSPELPVIHEGDFLLVKWGNKSTSVRLPQGGWCELEQLESGNWQWLRPEEVVIPASFGRQNGRWFLIESGVRGILVRGQSGGSHAYILTEPASHYYKIMTRHNRMPLLNGQRI